MTTEEIVEAARAAGFSTSEMMTRLPAFKRLIESAASAEREACAQVVDDFGDEWMCDSHELSKIIRARSQK